MSMNSYPIHSPLCFVIDRQVAPYLCLARDIQCKEVPPEVQALLDEGKFHEAAASDDINDPSWSILEAYEYDSIASAFESVMVMEGFPDLFYNSEVYGQVVYLNSDGTRSVRYEELNDDYLCIYEADNEVTPFKAAYANMDAFIEEVKSVFVPLEVFPDDFDWAAHVALVDGTYTS